ncbi:hypothetical protein SCHAM137S_08234 [Streptomyces chartreusis]|nr:hypothetical protein SAMN05216482_3371 [Streptomyces sp. PAN_FS17]
MSRKEEEPDLVALKRGRPTVREILRNRKINELGPAAGPSHTMREPVARHGSSRRQAGTMFSACGPFWPCVTSKLTFWPS